MVGLPPCARSIGSLRAPTQPIEHDNG